MVFTGIIYKTEKRNQKAAVTIIADSFEAAQKKLLSLYGKNLVSIIFEIEKNYGKEPVLESIEKIRLAKFS